MVDAITKALRRLSDKERSVFLDLLLRIRAGKFDHLDLKKLKGRGDIYRVRKGDMRVIFKKSTDDTVTILALERRSDTTYSDL